MALFSKKKQQEQRVEEQVVATTKPTVKQRIGNTARKVAQKTGLADKAQQVNERVQKAKDKAMRTYIIFSLMGALFFALTSVISIISKWKDDSTLFPYILIATGVYLLVFTIMLFVHVRDKKHVGQNIKKYKLSLKFFKTVLNLLFLVLAGLVFWDGLQNFDLRSGPLNVISTAISGLMLFVKLITTIFKLIKNIKKQRKLNKKMRASKAQEQTK